MKGRIWLEHCADNEWGNEVMRQIAQERFDADPSIDVVEVYEHAGWSLSWNRDGQIVGTANDAARLPPSVREWASQFDGFEMVGYCRRQEEFIHYFSNYYPALAAVA